MEDLRFKGGHYEYPHTANYETDLTFLIHRYKDLKGDYETLIDIYRIIKEKITEVTLEQLQEWLDDGTIENIINEKIFGDLNDRVDANTENIDGLKTKIDTNASDISTLKESVKTNGGNITTNSNNISENAKNIANNQKWSACDTVTTKGKIRVTANPAIWSSTNLTMGLNGICFAGNKVVQVFCSSTSSVNTDTTSIMVGDFNGSTFSNMVELTNLSLHGNSVTYIGNNICLIATVSNVVYVLNLANNSVTTLMSPVSLSGLVQCELGLYGTSGNNFYKLNFANGVLSVISSRVITGFPSGQVNQGLGYSNGHFLMPISRYNTVLALNSSGEIVKNMALTGSTAGELEDFDFYGDKLMGCVNIGNPNFNNGYFSFITEVDIFGHSEITAGLTERPSFARGNPLINLYQEKEIQLTRDNSFTRVYLRDGMLYLPTTGVKPITSVMSHILVRWSGASADGGEQTFFTDVMPLADFNKAGTDGKATVTRSRIYATGDIRHYSWNYNVSSSDNPWIDVGEPKLVTASIGGNNTLNTSGVEIIIHEVIGVRTN